MVKPAYCADEPYNVDAPKGHQLNWSNGFFKTKSKIGFHFMKPRNGSGMDPGSTYKINQYKS